MSGRGESTELTSTESNESNELIKSGGWGVANELTGPSGPLCLFLRHTLASYSIFLR